MTIEIQVPIISYSEYRRYTFAEKIVYREKFSRRVADELIKHAKPETMAEVVRVHVGKVRNIPIECAYLSPVFIKLRKFYIKEDAVIILVPSKERGIKIEL